MLNSSQIVILNEARNILSDLEKSARSEAWKVEKGDLVDAWDYGRLGEAAQTAEGAIFNVLNVASSHCHLTLSDEQLHNRKTEEVAA